MNTIMKYANLDLGTIEATFNILGGIEGAARLRRGELILVEAPPKSEFPLDFVIHVDRKVKPTYPDWAKKLKHPEWECSGPIEYNLKNEVEQWFFEMQKYQSVHGSRIYTHLKDSSTLVWCLNLQDGLAIQKKGLAMFRKLFEWKELFLWGSIVENHDGKLLVPYLYDFHEEVTMDWHCLDGYWDFRRPALRFKFKK